MTEVLLDKIIPSILDGGDQPGDKNDLTVWWQNAQNVVSIDTKPLLASVLDQLKTEVDYHSAAIVILTGGHATVLAFRGPVSQENLFDWPVLLQKPWLNQTIIADQRPMIVADIFGDNPEAHTFREALRNGSKAEPDHTRSWMGIPLIIKEKGIGMLSLTHEKPNHYVPKDVEQANIFARQVGAALEHDHLYQQALYLATLIERQRLAREMHDQLAQALGYINLKASMTNDLLAEGDLEEAQANLEELKRIARDTYTDVREEIFNLRINVSTGKQFLTTLNEYLTKYQEHYGIEVQLSVEEEAPLEIPAAVSNQIIRIIQEALSNVRKHALANKAAVHLRTDEQKIYLTVQDYGQGFDPELALGQNNKSFGLQIMAERAESVGGSLEIDSEAGQGTRLVLTLSR
jgi:signal transduction histidine kinase